MLDGLFIEVYGMEGVWVLTFVKQVIIYIYTVISIPKGRDQYVVKASLISFGLSIITLGFLQTPIFRG